MIVLLPILIRSFVSPYKQVEHKQHLLNSLLCITGMEVTSKLSSVVAGSVLMM